MVNDKHLETFAITHHMASIFVKLHRVGKILHNFLHFFLHLYLWEQSVSVRVYQNECLKTFDTIQNDSTYLDIEDSVVR